MQRTTKDLDPEAIVCSHHPNTEACLISLQKNAAKRLFCIECFSSKNTIPELTYLKKVISLSAINENQERHKRNKLRGLDFFIKSTLNEVDEIFEDYIKHVQTVQKKFKEDLTSTFKDNFLNNDDINIFESLKQKLRSFSKDHKLTDGPELESYLSAFETLENLKDSEELNKPLDDAKKKATEAIKNIREQIESLKHQIDTVKITSEQNDEDSENGLMECEENTDKEELDNSSTNSQSQVEVASKDQKKSDEEIHKESKLRSIFNINSDAKITSLSVSLDGKWVVWASDAISVVDLHKKILYHKFTRSTKDFVNSIDISRDGNQILSTQPTAITIWSISQKKMISNKYVDRGTNSIAKFSYDAQIFASAGNQTLRIWKRDKDDKLNTFLRNTGVHTKAINHLAFHPNGRYILTGGEDKKICCWDIDRELEKIFELSASCENWMDRFDFVQNGKMFMNITSDNCLELRDLDTRVVVHSVKPENLGEGSVEKISLIPGGLSVFSSYEKDGTVKIWNAEDIKNPVLLYSIYNKKKYCSCLTRVSQNLKYIAIQYDKWDAIIFEEIV